MIVFRRAASLGKLSALDLAITPDPGTVDGDVMIAVITIRTPNLADNPITAPPGWLLIDGTYDAGSPGVRTDTYWKIAAGGEGVPYTWTFGSSNESCGSILSYGGAHPTTPIYASAAVGQAAGSTTRTTPSINPAAGCWIVSYFADRSGSTWVGPDAERSEIKAPATSASQVVCDSGGPVVAGATDRTATASASTSVAEQGIIALAPEPTGASGTGSITAAATLTGTGIKRAMGSGAITATAALTGAGDNPNPPATFPDISLDVRVELLLDEWRDITGYVYLRDPITITGGVPDEGHQADPAKCVLVLDNRDGRFSPRNVHGPFYGLLGRNTPLRVSVPTASGTGRDYRAVVEVPSWPVKWDEGGHDVYIEVEASGILRRLGQGAKPLRSALYRALSTMSPPLDAYWSLEDGALSRVAAAGVVGHPPMLVAGDVEFGETGAPPGGGGAAGFARGGKLFAPVTMPATTPGGWTVSFYVTVPDEVQIEDAMPSVGWSTPGAGLVRWQTRLNVEDPDPSNLGRIVVWAFTAAGLAMTPSFATKQLLGGMHLVTCHAVQDGANLDLAWYVDGELQGDTLPGQTTIINETTRPITAMSINEVAIPGGATVTVPAVGQISHLMATTSRRLADVHAAAVPAGAGYAGETAGARLVRLAGEEAVPLTLTGDPAGTPAMGPQRVRALLDLLGECAQADGGTLGERRDALELAYRTRTADYSTPAALTLTYPEQLAAGLEPVDDDAHVRNDITVEREDGSSARVVREDGPLSVLAPPDGVGVYDESVTLNLADDSTLRDQAGWRVHLGTVDEARYPTVGTKLHKHPGLIPAVLAAGVRTHIRLTGLPVWAPPGTADLLIQGYEEVLELRRWTVEYNTVPASPWQVGVLDDPVLGRLDTDGSTLAAAVAATDTALSVATGGAYEDFEDTTYSVAWSGTWARSSAQAHTGAWSLKSAPIGHGVQSNALVTVPDGATRMGLWYRVSTEVGGDQFGIYVDGALALLTSGELPWRHTVLNVDGASTVTLRYAKNGATVAGLDAVWVDELWFDEHPLWTTDPAHVPFDIAVRGEVMTVTAITGTTPTQTFTVERDDPRAHPAGADVRLAQPMILAL